MNRKSVYLAAAGLLLLVAAGVQAANWDRAVYWDGRCRTGWADDASSIIVRDGLVAAGYKLVNADELKTWMDGHIADKALSVVVLARDNVPNTVVETVDASCTLRKYLDAGGKIVFYADIPFWDIAHTDGTWDNPQTAAQNAILGIGTDLVWDSSNTVTITGSGAAWGLTATWASLRATPAAKVDVVLATDNAGNAAAWVKFFVPGDWYRGFVRLFDRPGYPPVADIIRAAEYTGLTASAPQPPSGTVDVTSPLFQWTPSPVGVAHDVYFGTDPAFGAATFKGRQGFALYYATDPLIPGAQYFWRVDEVEADGVTIHQGDVWTFTVMPDKAYDVSPYDGAVNRNLDTKLSWKAGNMAESHDVYLGTDQAAVTAGDASVFKGNQAETSFDPNGLAYGITYYWRIDEVKAGGVKVAGDVLSFGTLTEGVHGARRDMYRNIGGGTAVSDLTNNAKYPGSPSGVTTTTDFEAPTDVADNYGQRLTAWLDVPAAGDYTFWVASDDASELWLGIDPPSAVKIASVAGWTPSRAWDTVATQKSEPIHLEAGKYFLMALMKEGGGGDNLAAAWQGGPIPERELILSGFITPFVPLWADGPKPAKGATNVPQRAKLSWGAGVEAGAHDVYLGTDPNAVAAATRETVDNYLGRVAETSLLTPDLAWGTTFYWRVDEVNEATGGLWKGPIWSFTTAADALMVNAGQLTLNYNNTAEPFISEFVFDTTADWTVNGLTDLALDFQGNSSHRLEEVEPGVFSVTARSGDVWGSVDNFRYVYKQLTGDGSVSAKVISQTRPATDWAKAGVMIRQDLSTGASHGFMVVTPNKRRAFQNRPVKGGNSVSAHSGANAITLPCWVKIERAGNVVTTFYSQDGVTWTQQPDTENTGGDKSPNPQTLELGETVYVGFAVTSNNTSNTTTVTFSDLSTTGNVSDAWELTDVGNFIPGNDKAPVFAELEDSAGAKAVVSFPDGTRVGQWWHWKIPLSDFAGVNLQSVAKLHVGVGDPLVPAADGRGRVLFSNIRAIKPVKLPTLGAAPVDITSTQDNVIGVPTNGNWPAAEVPSNVVDNNTGTKFLHFSGKTEHTGVCVQPFAGATIVTGLTFTTANDAPERDPVSFELYGSNDGLNGPWKLIVTGNICDFAQATPWPRKTIGATPISFNNTAAYTHYKVMFPTLRDIMKANSMQIAEVELLGTGTAEPATIVWVSFHGADDTPSAGAAGVGFTEAVDKPYTDLLKAQGYSVVRLVQTKTPDLAVVNAADLVIVGRSVASGSFQNDAATTWNGVTAPMMILNGYLARKSRMGFFTGSTMQDTTGDITLTTNNPAHPIFAGIALTGGTMTNPFAGLAVYPTDNTTAAGISFVANPIGDQGTVLATLSAASGSVPADSVAIAEWPAGATVTHDGGAGTDVLGGHRLVFLTGARENGGKSSETAGMYDLQPDGAQMFLNAVAYMLQ